MAIEMNLSQLAVRIRKELRSKNSPAFTLDVSLQIPAGISILFGPSGAGKSTLLDCVAGLLRPDTGRIAITEEVVFDTESGTDLPAQQRHIAYVFQSLALFPHMSVAQNVAYGLQHTPKVHADQLVKDILGAFRVEKLARRRPAEISGGEKQRVALARSLVTQPKALLLDEPLTGLDAELKTSIMHDLRIWNASQKIPILYVTHTREEVDALGERVIAMDHGRLLSTGTPREVLDAPRKKRLAQAAGFENLLAGVVLDLREADGVMRVRLSESNREIEVPLGYAVPGDTVRIAVRAGDILLASQPPVGLSARNILEGRIASLQPRGTLVIARVDCGAVFTAHVTPGAVRALDLAVDRPVWLVLKTHSCHLVD